MFQLVSSDYEPSLYVDFSKTVGTPISLWKKVGEVVPRVAA